MEPVLFRTRSCSVPVWSMNRSLSRIRVDPGLKFRNVPLAPFPTRCSLSGTGTGMDFGLKTRVIPTIKVGFPGGGIGRTRKNGKSCGGGGGDRRKLVVYYEEMLKSYPSDSLLLRNYGKYMHEVEGNMEKAEECYGRSILANPGDGELLSLYGKLIWEKEKDELRAKSYFNQALHASPNDCTVLGSYAQFLWEAEEEKDEDNEVSNSGCRGCNDGSKLSILAN